MNDLEQKPDYRIPVQEQLTRYQNSLNISLIACGVDVDAAAILAGHTPLAEDYIGRQNNLTYLDLTPAQQQEVLNTPIAKEITDLIMVVEEIKGMKGWNETELRPYTENTEALARLLQIQDVLEDQVIRSEGDLMIVKALSRLDITERDFLFAKELLEKQGQIDAITAMKQEVANSASEVERLDNEMAEVAEQRAQWIHKYRTETT